MATSEQISALQHASGVVAECVPIRDEMAPGGKPLWLVIRYSAHGVSIVGYRNRPDADAASTDLYGIGALHVDFFDNKFQVQIWDAAVGAEQVSEGIHWVTSDGHEYHTSIVLCSHVSMPTHVVDDVANA